MWTGLASKYFGDLVPEISTFSPQNSATQNKEAKEMFLISLEIGKKLS